MARLSSSSLFSASEVVVNSVKRTFQMLGFALVFVAVDVSAHPGRTNGDGCHAGSQAYHCHGKNRGVGADQTSGSYDRPSYGSWADADGDCKSTRHELLEQMNIGQLRYSTDGCRVVAGRWFGVFSGQYFYKARDMDIDHVFPIALADRLGARNWPREKKRLFFNDPANLLPVSASLNRSKGAKDPVQWLPPNRAFHCEYVTRFLRVGLKYRLIEGGYRTRLNIVRDQVCG